MEYDWVEVDGLKSQVGMRRHKDRCVHKKCPAIIIIPGNPGLARFYEDFANAIFDNIGDKISSIVILSNLGAVSRGPAQGTCGYFLINFQLNPI